MKAATSLSVLVILLLVTSCGGNGSGGSSSGNGGSGSPQGISGAWEFVAKSSVDGSTTLIEADLSANSSQTSATGPNQVQTATYFDNAWYVNGACPSASPGQNSVSGTVTGSNISLTFNEGGNVFTGQGSVSGTTVSGSYSGTSPNCPDSGTFTGTQVPDLSGTFSGTLFFISGTDQVTATLTEGNNYSLTVQTVLSGADNGNFTFSGSAVANVMFVSGTVSGGSFSLFGYFDKAGTYTGIPNSIAVFDYNTLAYDGVLIGQTTTSPPISIAFSPAPATSMLTNATQSLTAVVSNDSANKGVSWSVICGSGACGSFSSLTTASGQATTYTAPSAVPAGNTVTVTATSISDPTKSASATLTIDAASAISVVFNPPPPSLLVSGSTQLLTAVVSNDPANKGVKWTVTCANAGMCGTFNPTSTASGVPVSYTAPPAVPSGGIVTVQATSVADSTKSASATIAIVKPALADGNYVFTLAGSEPNLSFYNVAGVFTVSGGAIAGGEQDFVDSTNTDLHDAINPKASKFVTTTDGNLQLTLTTCAGTNCSAVDTVIGGGTGVETINGSIVSTSTCGTTGGPCRARLVEFDSFATSSGTLDLQDSSVAAIPITGIYAFEVQGGGVSIGGILNIASGAVSPTGTVLDFNLAGTPYADQSIAAASVSAPDATGRLQISITPSNSPNPPAVNLEGYIVDGSRIELISANTPIGGIAYFQNTSNLAVTGNSYVAGMTGFDGIGGFQAAGIFTMGPTGNVTGTLSTNDLAGGRAPATAITGGTFVADSTNLGRYTLTGVTDGITTFNMQLYVDGNGNALMLTMDSTDALAGLAFLQTTGASVSGTYVMADTGADITNEFELDAVGPVSTGSDTFSGFVDLNWLRTGNAATQSADLMVTGAFTAPSGGVSTGSGNTITGLDVTTASNADAFDYYVVDSTKVVAIETDSNQLTLGVFELIH